MFERDLGIFATCIAYKRPLHSLSFGQGLSESMSVKQAAAPKRLVLDAAAKMMDATGYGKLAPACHLRGVTKLANWNPHAEEVYRIVVNTMQLVEPMEKKAFSDAMSAAGLGLKGIGYGSLGLGTGLGALYWLLNRHASQDNADLSSMTNQVDYYNQLSRELDDSMRRKYRYDREAQHEPQVA